MKTKTHNSFSRSNRKLYISKRKRKEKNENVLRCARDLVTLKIMRSIDLRSLIRTNASNSGSSPCVFASIVKCVWRRSTHSPRKSDTSTSKRIDDNFGSASLESFRFRENSLCYVVRVWRSPIRYVYLLLYYNLVISD